MKLLLFMFSLTTTLNLHAWSCFSNQAPEEVVDLNTHHIANNAAVTTTAESGDAFTAVDGSVETGVGALSVTYSHDGSFAAVPNNSEETVSLYRVDCKTGAFTLLQTVLSGHNPATADFSPCDTHAVVANNDHQGPNPSITVYSINCETGEWSLIQTIDDASFFNTNSIKYSPDGKFVAATNNGSGANGSISLFRVSAISGKLIFLGNTPEPLIPVNLAFSPNGKFLAVTTRNSGGVSVYALDPIAGTLTSVGNFATGTTPIGVAYQHDGNFVAIANLSSDTITVYQVNPVTGAFFTAKTIYLPLGSNPAFVAYSPDDRLAVVTTSAVTEGSSYVFCVTDGVWCTTAVQALPPLPGTQNVDFAPCSDFAAISASNLEPEPGLVQVFSVNSDLCPVCP